MFIRWLALTTLACMPISVYADAADRDERWKITDAQRLAERFDPESARMRTAVATVHVRKAPADATAIEGATHAHLFFRWELMDFFLDPLVSAHPRTDFREVYRPAIESAGWQYDEFWRIVELNSADYVAIAQYVAGEQERFKGKVPESDRQRLDKHLCATRSAALTAIEESLGREKFDQFLYSEIAPHIVMWVDNGKRNAEVLLRSERGCK